MPLRNSSRSLSKKMEDLKVLIVDDQPEMRLMIREILGDAGVTRTFEATNGREAMQFIDADFETVNLIICDWHMPAMTGIDFLRQIRSVFPDMPFLMVTGKPSKNAVLEAKTAGVNAFISKPFSPSQMEAKLRVLVSNDGNETL